MIEATERLILKRLKPLYWAAFFQGFVLWYAIEKLFMVSIGFNNATIALATSLYVVVMLIMNVPYGVLADRWSRKGVLFIAIVMLILASIVCGLSHTYIQYLIGFMLWGMFYAGYTGTYDSIIYDLVLEETGSPNGFEKLYGRVQVYDSIALVIGSAAGGVIGHAFGLRIDYYLTAVFVSFSLISLYFFHEPTLHKKAVVLPIRHHLKEIVSSVTHSIIMLWITIAVICNVLVLRLVAEFSALWYLGLKLPESWYGPAAVLFFIGFGVGGYAAPWVSRSALRSLGVTGLAIIASAGLFTHHPLLIILCFALLISCMLNISVVVNRYLHDLLTSRIRAGASSLLTTAGYVVFIPTGIIFGIISRDHGIFIASWFVTIPLVVLFAALLAIVLHQKKNNE